MNARIIGISGKAQSGKDTVADLIMENMPEDWRIATGEDAVVKFNMGDLVREFIEEKFDLSVSYQIEHKDKGWMRNLTQLAGKVKRNQSAGLYWIDMMRVKVVKWLLKRKANGHLGENHLILIVGIRYNNELNELIRFGDKQPYDPFHVKPHHVEIRREIGWKSPIATPDDESEAGVTVHPSSHVIYNPTGSDYPSLLRDQVVNLLKACDI